MKRLSSYLLLLAALVMVGTALLPHGTASALSGSQFDAGHIIDDTVFYDGTSMSTSEVQNFLNSKVPTCDTNGTTNKSYYYNSKTGRVNNSADTWVTTSRATYGARYDKYYKTTIAAAPYTCLRNYKQNTPAKTAESGICGNLPAYSGRSAAAIITDVAAACGVSPKVLIVLLQKEQGLVTDVWPWDNEYQKATGFACPDTGGCDSTYYGFFNQVYSAARQFKRYRADPDNWNYVAGQSNKIYYNPNTSCGYSWVNIRNQATAGLYDYTPYQPNKAALNNLNGTGDSCSAYGNRNFWVYFNDWFGSPTDTLFKISGQGDAIYLNWGSTYYPIPSMAVLRAYGLASTPVRSIDSGQLSVMTKGPNLSIVAKFGTSATVYIIDNGEYHPIPSMAMLSSYGLDGTDNVTYADVNLLNSLRQGEGLHSLARLSNGAVYFIEGGNKHVFPDGRTLNALGPGLTGDPTLAHTDLSNDFVNTLTEGAPELINGTAVRAIGSQAIYLYDNAKLSWFSADAWNAWGKPLDYTNITGAEMNLIPSSGKPVSQLITDGSSNYLVDSGTKHLIDGATESAWGISGSSYVLYSTASEARIPSGSALGVLPRTPNGTVYLLRNQQKWPIASGSDFTTLGLSWSNVQTLQNSSVDLIPSSPSYAFGPNSLIRLPTTAIVWIDTNFVKHTIPSLDSFNNFGFRWDRVRKFPTASVSGYSEAGLQQLVRSSSNAYYLVDSGGKHAISSSLYSASGYNFATASSTPLNDKLLDAITNAKALTSFVQGSTATVYMVENGQKHPLSNQSALTSHGGSWSAVTHVSNSFLATIPVGSTYN